MNDKGIAEANVAAAANSAIREPGADLERLFREHNARVFRTAYRITGNPADAEDVLQTVFLRLARQRWTPDAVASIESYLCRAAINAALDLVHARSRQNVPLEEVAPALAADARLRPDRRQDARELRARLRQALARLNAKAAEIFALRYFEGYSNPEIAGMLGLSVTDVAVTLHRTRSRLQEEIRSFEGDMS